jgi:ABC-type lipoprotein export system ATPase subunit
MIEARDVYKQYVMGKVTLEVLKGVSLRVEPGTFLAIVGPSGAGKSTLLHLLAGLDSPTRGEVLWEAQPLSRMSDAKRAGFRSRMIGIVFQFYHLLPELSALENVMLPGLVNGRRRLSSAEPSEGVPRAKLEGDLRARAEACLEEVGLSARLRHRPGELSGGEQQRVAIARALANGPKALLCDEPTGNLDSKTGAEVVDVLLRARRQRDMALVLVTHQASLAASADRVVTLQDGRIVRDTSEAGSGKREAGSEPARAEKPEPSPQG